MLATATASTIGHRAARAVLLAGLVLSLLWAAPAARAQGVPEIAERPSISGEPYLGRTLTALGARFTGGTAFYVWFRCSAEGGDCRATQFGANPSYVIREGDVDRRILVVLVVAGTGGPRQTALSDLTGVIAREPAPAPAPAPPPAAAPEVPAAPATPAAPAPAAAPAAPVVVPTRIDPFPVVRIAGTVRRSGVRVSVLSVRAPAGARIGVRCVGRGCPGDRTYTARPVTRLRRYERFLRAGTKLSVRITQDGAIGKHVLFTVRGRRAPARVDRCLVPGSSRPTACPG